LSPAVASLAQSIMHGMVAAKVKAGIAVALALASMIGAATLAQHFVTAQQDAAAPGQAAGPTEPDSFVPPPFPVFPPIDEQVLSLAFSTDGKRLVTAGARHVHPGQV